MCMNIGLLRNFRSHWRQVLSMVLIYPEDLLPVCAALCSLVPFCVRANFYKFSNVTLHALSSVLPIKFSSSPPFH